MQSVVKKSLLAAAISASLSPSISSASEDNNVIVITSSRVEMAREQSGSAVTVLDSHYLEQNQIHQVSDALRHIPGIAVNRTSGPGSKTQVRIRGAEGDHTLVLIDGIEVNDVGGGSEFDFGHLLNIDIERIEVLRGAQSALWGSDAMGGVINIITKKGRGPLTAKLSVEVGSFDTHQTSLSLSGGDNTSHYALSGTFLNTDGISSLNKDRGNTEEDSYRNNSYNFKGGIEVTEELSLDLVLRHQDTDSDLDGFEWPAYVDNGSTSDNRQTFAKISAQLDLLDNRWKHKLSYSDGNTDYTTFANSIQDYTYKGEKQKIEYQTDYFFNTSTLDQRLTFVAEHEDESYFSKGYGTIDRKTDATNFVLEYGLNINDQYFLTVAGRRDLNDIFQNANTFSIAFSGWLTENLRLHSSTGTGIKNPTMFELFGSSKTYSGNSNLTPEENKTWDIGTEYQFDAIDGYLDLTIFRSEVKNKISGSGVSSVNLDSDVVIKGVELNLLLNPTDRISLNAAYSYTDSDDGTGSELDRRARHIANLSGSYLLSDNQTRLTSSLQHNGKQQDKNYLISTWPDPAPEVTLDSYTLLNIAVSHQLNDTVRLYGRVNNLLDESYEEVYGYGTEGRNFTLGIEITGGL